MTEQSITDRVVNWDHVNDVHRTATTDVDRTGFKRQ